MIAWQHNMTHYQWMMSQAPGTGRVQDYLVSSGHQLKEHTENMPVQEMGYSITPPHSQNIL